MAKTSSDGRFRTWGKLRKLNSESTDSLALSSITPLLKPLFSPVAEFSWLGGQNVPKTGPALIVANHVSSLDPVLLGLFLAHQGRWPHFLARANLWDNKLLRKILNSSRQIPVHRGTAQAADSLTAARESLARGDLVIIYPEGTITFDPQEWPMTIRSGAARLALTTGVKVIPVGQWGANYILPPRKIRKPNLRRREVRAVAGKPIDFSGLVSEQPSGEQIAQASNRILQAILKQTSEARREPAPRDVWDHRIKQRVAIR